MNSFTPNTIIQSSKINENFTGLADGSFMDDPTIDNPTLTDFAASGLYDNGNSGASKTITWSNGDRQKVTVTANTVFSYSGAVAGQALTLIIIEDGTGGYTITLPTTKWPNGVVIPFTTTANAINVITILFDGTNYLTQLAPGFA